MAFQFRKRIKIMPGVSVNIGKRGASISAGPRGARVTVGKHKTTLSAGIPGTGISERATLLDHQQEEESHQPAAERRPTWLDLAKAVGGVLVVWLVFKWVGMH